MEPVEEPLRVRAARAAVLDEDQDERAFAGDFAQVIGCTVGARGANGGGGLRRHRVCGGDHGGGDEVLLGLDEGHLAGCPESPAGADVNEEGATKEGRECQDEEDGVLHRGSSTIEGWDSAGWRSRHVTGKARGPASPVRPSPREERRFPSSRRKETLPLSREGPLGTGGARSFGLGSRRAGDPRRGADRVGRRESIRALDITLGAGAGRTIRRRRGGGGASPTRRGRGRRGSRRSSARRRSGC